MAVSFTKEQKAAVALQALCAFYGLKKAKDIAARRRKIIEDGKQKKGEGAIQKVPTGSNKLVDHPLVAWFFANLGPIVVAVAHQKLSSSLKFGESKISKVLKELVLVITLEEVHMAYCWFLCNQVYSHIPFFDKKRAKQTFGEVFSDYLTCNFPISVIGAIMQVFVFGPQKEMIRQKSPKSTRFRPLLFMFKLAYCRVMTDFLFWVGHYLMHKRENYWIHKRHHEHNKTKLTTNYHFDFRDFAIEAFIPYIISLASLLNLHSKLYVDKIEENMLFGYVLGLEMLSHCGKPLPVMSIFPPLSPLLTYWDDWNVWFHETHHNLLKCNYSITPYWDALFGTAKYP
mmetsp:Transcript_2673/g.3105  ORF Transcript_2673/g.3105 Transcript_2673/m.3105 type:complete len:342 (-) Transcript_2673:53-1078(-)